MAMESRCCKLIILRTHAAGLSNWFCPSVCMSVQCNLAIHGVKKLLNPTKTLQSPQESTKAVLLLVFPARFSTSGIIRHFKYGQPLEYSTGWVYTVSGHVFIPEVSV